MRLFITSPSSSFPFCPFGDGVDGFVPLGTAVIEKNKTKKLNKIHDFMQHYFLHSNFNEINNYVIPFCKIDNS